MRFIIAGLGRCKDAFTKSVLKDLEVHTTVLSSDDHVHQLKGYENEHDVKVFRPITFNCVEPKKSSVSLVAE